MRKLVFMLASLGTSTASAEISLTFETRPSFAPLDANEQAIRRYSKGRLANADMLDFEGKGFVKLNQKKKTGYAADEMITALKSTAAYMHNRFPGIERLQVGDLSKKGGGKLRGHSSHQNGLDADLSYYRTNLQEAINFKEKMTSMQKVKKNFHVEHNWAFMHYLVQNFEVNRIFIDQAIKDRLCAYVKENVSDDASASETLKKLRHWKGHATHMHVRLECPTSSPRCESLPLKVEGTGC